MTEHFANVTFTWVGMTLNCFACWLSFCTEPASIWSQLCVDDFEFLMVVLFHRRCIVQCWARCIWIDPPEMWTNRIYIVDRELMNSDHLHAGFYISWTSTDIGRVWSGSIPIIASCDCFCLSCDCCGCLYWWIQTRWRDWWMVIGGWNKRWRFLLGGWKKIIEVANTAYSKK